MSTYQDVEMGDESKHQGVNITSEKSDAGVVVRGVDSPEGTVHPLAEGGPLGIWLGYTIMGLVVGSMMIALGEMTTLYPVSGAFTHYTARFVDPALGFALGWNYWYSYAITLPTEITAAALVISYWRDDINVAVWITIFLVVICSFNFFGVRWYGEAEFWFSILKVLTIIGLIILGIIITAGGVPGAEPIGFRFWRNPGPFQQENGIPGSKGRFLAFWTVFVQAAFSYLGTEIVALTAGEAQNPRRNVPKAIRRTFFRILVFYVIGTFVMGLIVSPNDPNLTNASGVNASPWVIAIKNAGIKGLPSVVNAAVLLSAFSAGNSDLYASSRTLYGLACDGKAPAIFRRCTKSGLPVYCLIITAAVGLLAYMNVSTGSTTAFNYLSNLSSITGLITWACINFSYIRFYYGCKRQGIDRNEFPFKAPLQPWASMAGLFLIILVIIFNGYTVFLDGNWSTANFVVSYITVVIFAEWSREKKAELTLFRRSAVLYVGWKLYKRTKFVRLDTMDFDTGRRELDSMADEEAARYKRPTTFIGKVWDFLM
ncbi:hypothetical protein BMF94_4305 [Rhodotorula taiwanensis]|uniref:Amino acid permease/ SLC12A domain-containing protein n=1 Tax=Rhodotorula taiwanensis TaxID=741276 RepID=A0A2S5B6T1_9BASI|nr:hypothetical protein BMF94_4305 [Rhodotorula taiwanensis]